jgi:hypothetical protein
VLGGSEEFCGFIPSLASSFLIRSSNDSTRERTAEVISASSSGGIVSGLGWADDIADVVPQNPVRIQITLGTIGTDM